MAVIVNMRERKGPVVGTGERSKANAITLEQLIALNDEMAALVRTGVPLERGLAALGGELPGQPGKLAEMIAFRMGAGESLSQILSDEPGRFPPVWRAVVEAGLRSGRLASALESLSSTARRTAELRKLVGAGMIYPLIVVALAYVLFVVLVTWLAPIVLQVHLDLTDRSDAVLAGLDWVGQKAPWWVITLPVAVGILLAAWWRRSGRALWPGRDTGKPPAWNRREGWRGGGIRQTLHNGRMAAFAEVLSLLVKEKIPMHESVVLAAEASGDRAIVRASHRIADRLRRGDVIERREDLPPEFPPLLGWVLLTVGRQSQLSEALSRSAAVYRRRAARAASATAVFVPMSLTVLVGGAATLVCGLAAFVPVARLLYHLTWPLV